jgi:outer membrane protein assembly factor BamB
MIRKMQAIAIIAISLLIIAIGFKLHYHCKNPVESRTVNGTHVYLFNDILTEEDYLAVKPERNIGFLEARFSNHAIIRYEWPAQNPSTAQFSTWTDSSGRRKLLPVIVVRIGSPAGSEVILPLGKDYHSRTGSMDSSVCLNQIITNSGSTSVKLTNYPLHPAPVSGASTIELAAEFKLRDIAYPTSIDSAHVQTDEYICPSSDGLHLAVSSISGDLYYLESSRGKPDWNYHVPDGRLGDIVMSADDGFLFVGEHSADGNVYCLNAQTGKLVWKYATSTDIGSFKDSLPDSSTWSESIKPNVRDVIWRNHILFARSRRSRITLVNGMRVKSVISKVIAFREDSGKILWSYPTYGPIEGLQTSALNVSKDGNYVSLALFGSERKANPRILVLDGQTGKAIWDYQTDTISGYFKTSTCYEGLTFSPDSRYAAAALNDGRVLIFNNQASVHEKRGVVLKTVILVEPISAGTVPVTTFPATVKFAADAALVASTGQTHATSQASANLPPIDHPDSNSLFALDMNGELLWKTISGGYPAAFDLKAFDRNEYLAVAFSHNVHTRNISDHGFAVFDIKREGGSSTKIKSFFHTNGICIGARLSPDLSRLFVIEAAVDMDPTEKQDFRGKHRLLIFNLNRE